MFKINYFIKSFGNAAAYRLYVYMLCLLQGDRSRQHVCQELEYRIDVCRVTRGAHIEHL